MKRDNVLAYGSAIGLPGLAYTVHPHGSFIFPPLGSLGALIFPVVLGLVHLTRHFTWGVFTRKGTLIVVSLALLLTLSSLFAYFQAALTYIVSVPYVGDHRIIYVSAGTEETAFAKDHYPGETRTEMLSKRGVDDGAIYKLWEADSVNLGRIELFSFYTLLVISFSSLGGAIARLKDITESETLTGVA